MTGDGPATPVHVLIAVEFPDSFVDRVRGVGDRLVVHHRPVSGADDEIPTDLLRYSEVLYTGDLLPGRDAAPALRWVQLDTSGVDHVRVSPLWESDAQLTTLGGISPSPIAEWVLMMVLAHAHHLRLTESLAAKSEWPSREYRWTQLMPRDLRRCTMGIVGYGQIGREVARLCRSFGMRVLAVRRDATTSAGEQFRPVAPSDEVRVVDVGGLPDVLRASDYVVLTVPLTSGTEGMIGESAIEAMKPGAVLINASRGGIVDEDALYSALERGHLDMIASDVFLDEPLPSTSPFWSHPRSVVTPHVAGFAPDYVEAVGDLFTENLRRYLNGQPLLNLADRGREY